MGALFRRLGAAFYTSAAFNAEACRNAAGVMHLPCDYNEEATVDTISPEDWERVYELHAMGIELFNQLEIPELVRFSWNF